MLRIQGEHVQMWVQDDLDLDLDALQRSADVFDQRIYPTNRRVFGPEPSPGIDGDSRLWVLNADVRGAAGYFTSVNTRPRSVDPESNEAEMFVMNVTALAPGSDAYDAVLAHEFQHMIHWYSDGNEETWLQEGMSGLAEELNGYGPPTSQIALYAEQPDLQLNTWNDEPGHYGASYLFVRWLWGQYGDEMLRDLVADQRNGMDSVSCWLDQNTATTLEQVFTTWAAEMWDQDQDMASVLGEPFRAQRIVARYPYAYKDTVYQYGVDALEIGLPDSGELKVAFEAAPTARIVPIEAHSGDMQWWSNRGDMGHSALQRVVDLRRVSVAALTFWLWYDIEAGWDHAYLRVSRDGGQSWQLLRTEGMVEHALRANGDLLGTQESVGYGYTGRSVGDAEIGSGSGAWHQKRVDLTAYAGQEILLSFDYITDDAMNRPGLGLDDLAIDAIGFSDDAERDRGWDSMGFVRHGNRLPQTYVVQWLSGGAALSAQRLDVRNGHGEWRLQAGDGVEDGLLLVSALAPVTTEVAPYRISLEHLP